MVYVSKSSPAALEILTPVSKSASVSVPWNPVMLQVSVESVAPYTLVSASAVTVKSAAVIVKSAVTKLTVQLLSAAADGVMVYVPTSSPTALEILTPVSKSASFSPPTNPVMVEMGIYSVPL